MPATPSVEIALMVPAVSAALADGVIADEEITQLMALCLQSPLFEENSEDEDTEIIARAVEAVQASGHAAACASAALTLSPELRETAFAFAVAIVASDGRIAPSEEALLERLIGWLQIGRARAEAIMSVIPVLQNGR